MAIPDDADDDLPPNEDEKVPYVDIQWLNLYMASG